jgi:hypothetical protein
MQRRHPIIFCASIAAVLLIAGCKNKKEIHYAKSSAYDADFAVVFNAALEATRALYTNLDDYPASGKIKTAWHQVAFANNQDDLSNQRIVAQSQGLTSTTLSGAQIATGMPTRLAYKRHFIRFDVSVVGGRPWRVKVVGYAAEWDPGNAMPTELRGAARPPWLDGRIEALQVAIYRKIKQYAVPLQEEVVVEAAPELPKTDPSTFKNVPAAAASALAAIKDALALRDYTALRAQVADDVVCSLGGAEGADVAMVLWQADPERLDAMAKLIAGGCGEVEGTVACPVGEPEPGAWQLVLEPRGDAWKISSFIKAE